MNKLDGPNDQQIDNAILDKARNIGAVVKRSGAALLVVQEAPGPQLRESGGKISKQVAEERRFEKALRQELPGFAAKGVGSAEYRLQSKHSHRILTGLDKTLNSSQVPLHNKKPNDKPSKQAAEEDDDGAFANLTNHY